MAFKMSKPCLPYDYINKTYIQLSICIWMLISNKDFTYFIFLRQAIYTLLEHDVQDSQPTAAFEIGMF